MVRASGGYLPPRHPLSALELSPATTPVHGQSDVVVESVDAAAIEAGLESGDFSSEEEDLSTLGPSPRRRGPRARGAARANAKGPEEGGLPAQASGYRESGLGQAPTEEAYVSKRAQLLSDRRWQSSERLRKPPGSRPGAISGVLSGLADWLMPGMEDGRRAEGGNEVILDVYPRAAERTAARTPPRVRARSAPPTPRGRPKASTILREGGWFYNGDSDYSTEEEDTGSFESEDEGFWADAGTTEPPRKLGGGGGMGILGRLRKLFS